MIASDAYIRYASDFHVRVARVIIDSSLQSSVSRHNEKDDLGVMKRSATRPTMKRYSSEAIIEKELLALSILCLYRFDTLFFPLLLDGEEGKNWLSDVIAVIRDPGSATLPLSALRTYIHAANWMLEQPTGSPYHGAATYWLGITV